MLTHHPHAAIRSHDLEVEMAEPAVPDPGHSHLQQRVLHPNQEARHGTLRPGLLLLSIFVMMIHSHPLVFLRNHGCFV